MDGCMRLPGPRSLAAHPAPVWPPGALPMLHCATRARSCIRWAASWLQAGTATAAAACRPPSFNAPHLPRRVDELRYAAEKYGRVKDVYIPKVRLRDPTVWAGGCGCFFLLACRVQIIPDSLIRRAPATATPLARRTFTAAAPAASPLWRCGTASWTAAPGWDASWMHACVLLLRPEAPHSGRDCPTACLSTPPCWPAPATLPRLTYSTPPPCSPPTAVRRPPGCRGCQVQPGPLRGGRLRDLRPVCHARAAPAGTGRRPGCAGRGGWERCQTSGDVARALSFVDAEAQRLAHQAGCRCTCRTCPHPCRAPCCRPLQPTAGAAGMAAAATAVATMVARTAGAAARAAGTGGAARTAAAAAGTGAAGRGTGEGLGNASNSMRLLGLGVGGRTASSCRHGISPANRLSMHGAGPAWHLLANPRTAPALHSPNPA